MQEQIKAQEKKIHDLEKCIQIGLSLKNQNIKHLELMIEIMNLESSSYLNRAKNIKEKHDDCANNLKNEFASVSDNIEALRKIIESEEINKIHIENNCCYSNDDSQITLNPQKFSFFMKEIQDLKTKIINKMKNNSIIQNEANELLYKNNILNDDIKLLIECLDLKNNNDRFKLIKAKYVN